ncbi:MAG: T9SS type A sorting domain-containing protein [Flavobacteriales bacterium]|nr:T9SS type A sorting domain-containing protein [Flavobacteriales bacterium]NUQ14996.1 T9SS type A sorting domain-containing protein [Flavobacteriales bacterium]
MRPGALPLVLALLFAGAGHAQLLMMNHRLVPEGASRRLLPLDLGGGNTLFFSERAFGWDSSRVVLHFTGPDHALLDATAFRGHSPNTFLLDAEALDTGYVLCGSQNSAGLSYAFITRLSATGAVVWSRSLDDIGGVNFFQDQVSTLIPVGEDFTAYTDRAGGMAGGSFRFFGDADGSTWTAQKLTAPAGVLYNIFGGQDPGNNEHSLFGTGAMAANDEDRSLMAMQADLAGVAWMKFYDMLPTDGTENALARLPLAGGGSVLAGALATGPSTNEGCLLELAPDGSVLWCKRYADASGGLVLAAVVERPGGGLFAAGADADYRAMLLELDDDGDLVTAYRYEPPTPSFEVVQGFQVNDIGQLRLITRDKVLGLLPGDLCEFVEVTTVTAAAHTPTITTHAVGTSVHVPVTTVLTAPLRANDLAWELTCVVGATGEVNGPDAALAWPNPTEAVVHLGAAGALGPGEPVVVRDAPGRLLVAGTYGTGIDLANLPPGMYLVEVPRTGLRARVMRR